LGSLTPIDVYKIEILRYLIFCYPEPEVCFVSVIVQKDTSLAHANETNFRFRIAEYQVPKDFNFVYVDWGQGPQAVTELITAKLYDGTISDVVISFDPSLIDDDTEHLYGKQHLIFEVRISDRKGRLVDQVTIRDIQICPTEPSPRHNFYGSSGCNLVDVNLNNFLRRKTYDLDEWSNIEINVKHDATKYSQKAVGRRVNIFLQRYTNFDLDVSFPAGLLIRKEGEDFGTLSGISLAVVAQLSFYNFKRCFLINLVDSKKINSSDFSY